MAISVPELAGTPHLPRAANPAREWATARGRYRVRVGWHIAHISDNQMDVLRLVDGRHTVAEIAAELAHRQHRPVHPAEVAYLLRGRLAAAGLVRLRRGHLGLGAAQLPAFAAPTVPLADERAPASEMTLQAAPLLVAAAGSVQAPVAASEHLAPAAHSISEPASDVASLLTATPTPEPMLSSLPPAREPDAAAGDETLAQFESRATLPSVLASAPDNAPVDDRPTLHGADAADNTLAHVAELAGPKAAVAPPDDEPTLIFPREAAAWVPLPAPEAAPHAADEAPDADMPATRQPPRAAAQSTPTPATTGAGSLARPPVRRTRRAGRGVGRVVLELAGIALLALVVAVALRSLSLGGDATPRPTPTRVPTATATPLQARILPGETAYEVLSGDTLSTVAARTHISEGALALVNAAVLGSSGTLTPGMRLAIPAVYQPGVPASQQPRPLYYTLRSGDTLYQLGQLFGVDWHTIATYNHITDQYGLIVGQGIIIPTQP